MAHQGDTRRFAKSKQTEAWYSEAKMVKCAKEKCPNHGKVLKKAGNSNQNMAISKKTSANKDFTNKVSQGKR